MIIPTMSDIEIQREVERDLPEIVSYVDNRDSKYRRAVIKATRFPLYFAPAFRKTKAGNNWMILFEARSKKDMKDSRVTFVCYFNAPNGYYAVMPSSTSGKFHFIFYQPHFFSRYGQRFGSEKHGIELIAEYFKLNYSYAFEVNDSFIDEKHFVRDVYGSSLHGVAMGVSLNSGNVFFRTFVTYDMLKGQQIEVYTRNEQVRKEIHENE